MLFKKRAIEAIRDHNGQLPPPNEILELSKSIPTMRTNVKIETFDALTGKLKDFEEGHNFLSLFGIELLKQIQKQYMFQNSPNNSAVMAETVRHFKPDNSYGAWRYLFLTDSAMPEDPANETVIPGTKIVGYADKMAYTGTDIYRGSINQNESFLSDAQSRFVFDFATDKANGVIQSVGFCRALVIGGWSSHIPIADGMVMPNYNMTAGYKPFCYSNGYIYGFSGTTVVKMDTDGKILQTYTLASTSHNSRYCVIGNYIFYATNSQNSYLQRFDMTTGVTTQSSVYMYYINQQMLFTDGSYLYCLSYNSTTLNKIDPETFAVIGTRALPAFSLAGYTVAASGVQYGFGSNLYCYATKVGSYPPPISNTSSVCYIRYDWDTNSLDTSDIFYNPTTVDSYSYATNIMGDDQYVYTFSPIDNFFGSTDERLYNPSVMSTIFKMKKIPVANLRNPRFNNMVTRKLLSEPIIKNNTKTMKITYDTMFV